MRLSLQVLFGLACGVSLIFFVLAPAEPSAHSNRLRSEIGFESASTNKLIPSEVVISRQDFQDPFLLLETPNAQVQVRSEGRLLPDAQVSILSLRELSRIREWSGLPLGVVTQDFVFQYGVEARCNSNGLVGLKEEEVPCFVASRIGRMAGMVVVFPDSPRGVALPLQLRQKYSIGLQLSYHNGESVGSVASTLTTLSEDWDSQLFGQVSSRSDKDGFVSFQLSNLAGRLFFEREAVYREIRYLNDINPGFNPYLRQLEELAFFLSVSMCGTPPEVIALDATKREDVIQEVTLSAGYLEILVQKSDGTRLPSIVLIASAGSSKPGATNIRLACPDGHGIIRNTGLKQQFRIQVFSEAISGNMERFLEGPQLGGEQLEVKFVVEDFPRLAGALVLESGNPVAERSLAVEYQTAEKVWKSEIRTDLAGRFEVFLPLALHNQRIDEIRIVQHYYVKRRLQTRKAIIPIHSLFAHFEDLGSFTLE